MIAKTTEESSYVPVVLPPLPIAVSEDVLRTAERLGVVEQLPGVIALSQELFGEAITLCVTEDPELEDWTHIAVEAFLEGTVEEATAKQEKWCDSLLDRIGNAAYSFTLQASFA
jgi:hypothetical protein